MAVRNFASCLQSLQFLKIPPFTRQRYAIKQSLLLTSLIATDTPQDPDCLEEILTSSKMEDSSSVHTGYGVYKKNKEMS